MGLFSKLIDKLRGVSGAASAPSPKGKPADAQARPNGGRRRPGDRPAGERPRPNGGAKMRGPKPKSVTAVPSQKEAETSAPAADREPAAESARRPRPDRGGRPERGDRPRRDREGSGDRARRDRGDRPRGPKGDASERRTPRGQRRPGGAFTPEQLAEFAAAHAAWDPASYAVPEEEGKVRFTDLNLPGEILHAVADLGFRYCTPIQAESLGYSLEGKNVAGRAQTGTGKTAAFLIAILTRYLRTPEKRLRPGSPRALVLAPTRELVIQICKDAEALGRYCGDVRSLAVYGGMDYERQREELEDAPVDILVATPGRLLDFVRGHVVDLHQVDTLVIDEADRMLDMGFIPDVRAIVNRMPDRDHRCTMLYSATLNETVMRLASMWMRDPVRVEIASESLATDTVRQVVYIARADEKFRLLYNHLARYADARTIVFCNRKSTTERVCDGLRRRGIRCEMLSGDVAQAKRMKVLEAFRAGTVRTVVATDVAGRGIHVDDVAFVVNFDFPYEPEDYVHRIGRTGRAGHTGTAISFADEDESFIIPDIEKYINETLKCTMPEEWMYAELPEPEPRRPSGRGDRGERGRRGPKSGSAAAASAGDAPAAEASDAAPAADASASAETAAEVPAAASAAAETPVTEVPVAEPAPAEISVAEVPAVAEEPSVGSAVAETSVAEAPVAGTSAADEPVAGAAAEASASAEVPVAEMPAAEPTPSAEPTPDAGTPAAASEAPASAEPVASGASAESAGGTQPAEAPSGRARPEGIRRQRPPRANRARRQGDPRPQGESRGRQDRRQGRPPRGDRPVAARFGQRTQAQGPRDGSESHHAAAAAPRPIYVPPGARHGVIADEWTPGQK